MPREPNCQYVCQNCGLTVLRYVRPCRIRTFGQPKYCGNPCYLAATKGLPREHRPSAMLRCVVCDRPFWKHGSKLAGTKYCSWECQHKALDHEEGTRRQDDRGYWHVKQKKHPHANNGWIFEHRLVVENELREKEPRSPFLVRGRLHRMCHVHHVNGDKQDNRPENLQPMWPTDHHGLQKGRYHLPENSAETKLCRACGEVKPRDEFYDCPSKYDGSSDLCKPCTAVENASRRDYHREYMRRRRERLKAQR